MLYWICPECGRECSPAIRECPTCTAPPAAQQTAASPAVTNPAVTNNELLSLAQNFQSAPAVALLAPPPPIAVQEPEPEPEPELSDKLASLDGLDVRPARPARSEPVKPIPAPVPARISAPSAPVVALPTPQTRLQPAGAIPAGEIHFQSARSAQPKPFDQRTEPLPSRRQSVAFVRAELPVFADHKGMAFADLTQLDDKPLKPVLPHPNGQPQNGVSAPLSYKPSELSLVSSRLKLAGESLTDLLNAVKTAADEFEQAAIHAIQASFRDQPAIGLLSAPSEIVTTPPAAQWIRSEKPKFTPIAPEHAGRATVTAGPQAPPLAGPSLPRELVNFEPRDSSLRRNRRRKAGWPVSLLIATVFLLAVGSLLQYVTQDRDTRTASADTPVQHAKAVSAAQTGVIVEHPAARSVEVAGIRVVSGPNKRPQLQYIVINHSSSEVTGLNIRIAVRSVESVSDAPLFSVSSAVASLGPNQSKEIRADLDSSIAASSIPDWHSLRTDVLVGRQ